MIEVSLAKWSTDGYPGVVPGDIANSSKPGHWATVGINLFESLKSGRMATWRHHHALSRPGPAVQPGGGAARR